MFPFAGPCPFPFHRTEAKVLFDVLVRDVGQTGQIDLLIRSAMAVVVPLNLNNLSILEIWRQGVDMVARAGALTQFLEQLMRQDNLPAVQDAAKALLAVRPAVERHIHAGRVVVDREDLRREITLLTDRPDEFESAQVLLVRGGPRSGKSWSRHLFEQVARDQGAEVTYLAQGTVGTVREVLDKLFGLLDAKDLIPQKDSSDDAWYRVASNALGAAAIRRQKALWIAVDDLGPGEDGKTPLMDKPIREFFETFAMQLVDPAMNRWFRLMLIHYPDGKIPTRWDTDMWREDRPDRDKVDTEAVVKVLRERLSDRNEDAPAETVKSWAEQVIAAAADVPAEERLRSIQLALMSRLRTLAGGTP